MVKETVANLLVGTSGGNWGEKGLRVLPIQSARGMTSDGSP